jgi:hypothetical protein
MYKNASIWDDEELYRSVRSELAAEEYIFDRGKLQIRSNAFRDINKKPSVDRAKLKEFAPFCSKLSDTDGIVSLMTADVRAIGTVKTKDQNADIVVHAVDVIYDPNPKSNPENYAHSQIIVNPDFFETDIFDTDSKKERTFYKLKKALARLATKRGWTLEPKTN